MSIVGSVMISLDETVASADKRFKVMRLLDFEFGSKQIVGPVSRL